MNADFEEYIEKIVIPQMKEQELVKMTVFNAEGNKAFITRDKHGFFKATFTLTKEYFGE